MDKDKLPGGFLLLCLMGAFAIFSSTMSKSPTLTWFSEYLQASDFEIGLIAAASTVTGIFVNITAGTLSDIYGRRKLLITSGLIFASAPFLYLVITEVWQLILLRIYHGFATAIFMPVSLAFIADIFASERGEKMGLFSSSTMIGRLLAPITAGFLVSIQFLAPFQLAYLICGLVGLVAMLISFRIKPQEKVEQTTETNRVGVIEGLRAVIGNPSILTASSAEAATYFSIGAVETFMPKYSDDIGIERWITGIIIGLQILTIAILRPTFGRLSDRYGRKPFIIAGLTVSAVSLIFLPLTADFYKLLLVMIIHGIGISLTTSSTSPLISELSSQTTLGSGMGALETIKDIGHATGPLVAGFLIGASGYFNSFLVVCLILLVDLAVVYGKLRP
ncbi:MAG TPA: MFS transporter [Candidatus Bathyarchaeota archaeon]|nr:MFS transporter [Candidatus Bathyarchaeota archaeon]